MFRDALAQMDHPLLKVWSEEAASTKATIRGLPELEDLRRGGIADVLACAQRSDKGFAIVGLYIAYRGAAACFITSRRARNFSKMVRLAVGSVSTEEAARSVAARTFGSGVSRRGRTASTAGSYMWTPVVAARQGRIVRGALKRGSIVLPFCDGCGRPRRAKRGARGAGTCFIVPWSARRPRGRGPSPATRGPALRWGISRSGPGP